MKKLLLASLFVVLGFSQVTASHIMGGEITWECLTSGPNVGKYIFRMKIYRDCNGIPLTSPTELIEVFGGASVSTITMTKLAIGGVNDVSPQCTPYVGAPTIDCATAEGPGGVVAGAVQEHVYQSSPITLTGIPPASGWVFTWSSCCRNGAIVNVSPNGHTLRAIMYPFIDPVTGAPKNANPCFDSSPEFKESARVVICTGYPYSYSNNASDKELDSIYYDWAQPLDDGSGWPVPALAFIAPYTFTAPFPASFGTTFDNASGRISMTPNAGGAYVLCVKAETWKCGQKVAEIYRDVQQWFLTGCGVNFPPTINSITALPNSVPLTAQGNNLWTATAVPGDVVAFDLQAGDLDFNPPGAFPLQTIKFEANGGQLGVPLSSSTNGCIAPPCATIVPTAPQASFVQLLNNNISFNWNIDCAHLTAAAGCGATTNTFVFNLRMQDDFCPAPAISIAVIKVNVVNLPAYPPTFNCLAPGAGGLTSLSWIPPTDTGFAFNYYVVYHQPAGGSSYVAVDTIYNYNTTTVSLPITGGSFYIRTNSNCDVLSFPSDTLQFVNMNLTALPPTNSQFAVLSWNSIYPAGSQGETYEIMAEVPSGSGNILSLGSTTALNYTDTVNFCGTQVRYFVRTDLDGTGCYSLSDSDSGFFSDIINDDVMVLDSLSLTPGGQLQVAWQTSSSGDVVNYYLLRFNAASGVWDIVDTIPQGAPMPHIFPGSNATAESEQYKVISVDSCGNQSNDLLVAHHRTMFLGAYLDKCNASLELNWNDYEGFEVDNYQVWLEETDLGGNVLPATMIIATSGNTYTLPNLIQDHNYCVWVIATDTSGTVTASSNRECIVADVPNKSRILYLAEVTSNENDIEVYTILDGQADVTSFALERADNPIGPFLAVANVPKPSGPPYQLVINDFGADPSTRRYFYRVSAIDSCGGRDTTSNISRNILLEVEPQGNLVNILRWNPYSSWLGQVARYEIYRSVDNDYSYTKIADVAGTDTLYYDQARTAGSTNGQFCYYVKAIESGNPLGVVNPDGGPIESNSNDVCVIHNARVFVPAAFAPNSEIPENRVFKPSNLFAQPGSYRMYLMNRWGEVVFDTRDIDMGWDGTHNGQPAPMGSYVYIIEYRSLDGLPVILRGSFTLVP